MISALTFAIVSSVEVVALDVDVWSRLGFVYRVARAVVALVDVVTFSAVLTRIAEAIVDC